MKARPRLVERLPAMGVLAQVCEQLQAEEHVFVPIRPRLDFASMVMMVMRRGTDRGRRRTSSGGTCTDGILPCRRRPNIRCSPRTSNTVHCRRCWGEKLACSLTCGRHRHRKVSGARPRRAFTRRTHSYTSCKSISNRTSGRSIERTRSPGGRAHREVIVRLERDDPVLNSDSGNTPLVVDDDVCVRRHVDPTPTWSRGCGGIGDYAYCSSRMCCADCACTCCFCGLTLLSLR